MADKRSLHTVAALLGAFISLVPPQGAWAQQQQPHPSSNPPVVFRQNVPGGMVPVGSLPPVDVKHVQSAKGSKGDGETKPHEETEEEKKARKDAEERQRQWEEAERRRKAEAERKLKVCKAAFNSEDLKETEEKLNLCDNGRILSIMNKDNQVTPKDYFSCLDSMKAAGVGNSAIFTDCSDTGKRQAILRSDFRKCLVALPEITGPLGGGEIYSTCSSESRQSIVLGNLFRSCADRLKPIENSGSEILQRCASGHASEIATSSFTSCHSKVVSLNMSAREGINTCQEKRRQDGILDRNFDPCLTNLGSFNAKGNHVILFCSNLGISGQVASGKGVQCLTEMSAVTFKNFIHFAVYDEANGGIRWISNAMRDCSNGKRASTKSGGQARLLKEINIHTQERSTGADRAGRKDVQIGGVSGLSFDESTGSLYMLSDANPNTGNSDGLPPRIYEMKLAGEDANFALSDKGITFLTGPKQSRLALDSEGLGRLSTGGFVVSSEIDSLSEAGAKQGIRYINLFDANGEWKKGIDLPENFAEEKKKPANGKKNAGRGELEWITSEIFQNNKGLEALSLAPSENFLFAANEQPLLIDEVEPVCTMKKKSGSEPSGSGAPAPGKDVMKDGVLHLGAGPGFSFQQPVSRDEQAPSMGNDAAQVMINPPASIENRGQGANGQDPKAGGPLPKVNGRESRDPRDRSRSSGGREVRVCTKQKDSVRIVRFSRNQDDFKVDSQYRYELESNVGNGLSEILALNDSDVLTLERGWDSAARKVTARIFLVHLTQENMFTGSAPIAQQPVAQKKLVLDLDEVIGDLGPGLHNIDNLEAMAIGPKLKDGRRTLILSSDNNFSRGQRTQVLVLELSPEISELIH